MIRSYDFTGLRKWYGVAFLNLVVLSILGLLLRYKINFELGWLQQKNLLHAHSHFAFTGWITFILQLFILDEFCSYSKRSARYWSRFFAVSTFVNYALVISFIVAGYSAISITLSTVSIVLSYIFAYKVYKLLAPADSNKVSTLFIKGSLLFLVLSSFGTYALTLIITTHSPHQYWYHNALYFFLHFQYNGWFTFAVLGFLMKKLEVSKAYNYDDARRFFWLLAVTCVPAYFFTSLWHDRPVPITVIIIITAVIQTGALYYLYKLLAKNRKHVFESQPAICRWLYSVAVSAFILKILLQFFSAFPKLQQLAFGFRPIIIGYLHLIFLVFVTLYIISFAAEKKIIAPHRTITLLGLAIFSAGVILNELLLAIQGFAAISYQYFPWLNKLLYYDTYIMLAGAVFLFNASFNREDVRFYSSKPIFKL